MIGLIKFFLGIIPKTSEIEEKEAALIKEFEELKQYKDSDDLKRYEELKAFVTAPDFKSKKKAIESQDFKSTKEFKELQRLEALRKSAIVKNYNSIIGSHEYEEYVQIEKSKEYADESKLDEETKNSQRYKIYIKHKTSEEYKQFDAFCKSGLKELQDLEAYVNSDEFKQVKEYMELPAKEKWARSEECKKFTEYTELSNSEKIKWYFKVKDSKKFDELKKWTVTFEDNFDAQKLDKNKWLTRYFWGDAMLQESYSLTSDLHYITEGNNVELSNGALKIVTRQEKATGKSWDPERGFFPREFDYTSGLINTGKSFRQQHGRFAAKIKLTGGQAASHAVSLMSNLIIPQIDIFKYDDGKFMMNFFGGNVQNVLKKVKKFSSSKIENDYFIFEVEWSPSSIVWKLNGLELRSQKESLPNEPMYLFIGSALYRDPGTQTMPSAFEVDWVRCYQKA